MVRKIFSFKYVATILLTVGIVIVGGLNVQQKRRYIPPDDGASWVQGPAGIEARLILADGPAVKAGILRGDIVKAINGRAIQNDRQVTQILYELGAWSKASYTLQRRGTVFDVDVVIGPQPERVLRQQTYLEIIGLLYFLVGIFVLLKRSRAPHALHFYFVCLTSFVLYVFHFTGKFNPFDWTIFWSDLVAGLLLPPLFLHFCLEFPLRNKLIRQRRGLLYLIYVPGAALLAAQLAFVNGVIGLAPSPIVLRNILENLGDFHFGLYCVLSGVVLFQTYLMGG